MARTFAFGDFGGSSSVESYFFFLGTWGVVKVNVNILFVCLFVRLFVC